MASEDKKPVQRILPMLTERMVDRDPEQAELLLDSIPLAERVQAVLERRGKERLELLLLSKDAQAIVQMMPEEEVYFTIKEIGEEDALPLITMTTPEQLAYILDLEWWYKERLDPLLVIRWIGLLLECGEDKIMEWVRRADDELLNVIFTRFIRVYKPDPDDEGSEPWRGLPLFTEDNVYYVHIIDQNLAPNIEQLLHIVRAEEPDLYYSLLDQFDMTLTAEEEDLAYHFRCARLADRGFVSFDEAMEIYAYLPQEQMTAREAGAPRPKIFSDFFGLAPRFGLMLPETGPFLGQVLQQMDDEGIIEDVRYGIAWLTNRVLIADAVDLGQPAAISGSLEKVLGYLDIGLQVWSAGDLIKAEKLLRTQELNDIFRAGYSRALDAHKRAVRFWGEGWPRQVEEPLDLVGEPDGSILEGLLKARPQFFSGLSERGGRQYREFRSREELHRADTCVTQAELIGWLMFEVLGLNTDDLAELRRHNLPRLTFSAVFLTAFARSVSAGRFAFRPLESGELKPAIDAIFTPAPKRNVRAELRDDLIRWIKRRMPQVAEEQRQRVGTWISRGLEMLEEEIGPIRPDDLDPRFITTLAVSAEDEEK